LKPVRNLLSFFVFSNLFIAVCAVLMVYQTFLMLLNTAANFEITGFVFFSTICSYSFHWYFTDHSVLPSKRINWLRNNKHIHLIFLIAGTAGAAYFAFLLLSYWPWLIAGIIPTFLYSAPKIPNKYFRVLRRVAIGKTIFLALIWMYVTVVLPIIISGEPWSREFTLFAINRYFLIYAICILFDYRDREDDKADGIRSLITYLNEKSITRLFIFSLFICIITVVLLFKSGFGSVDLIILFIPAIIVAFLYPYARKNFSDMLYYLFLDGLMALSALLLLISRI